MKSSAKPSQHLKVREWLAVLILIGCIAGLSLITSLNTHNLNSSKSQVNRYAQFDVLVKGSVKYPGIYHLSSPISMRDLLDLAQPTEDADLKRYKMELMIQRGRSVNVPKKRVNIEKQRKNRSGVAS